MRRAAVLYEPAQPAGFGQLGALQSAAASLGVEISPLNARDAPAIERAIAAFVRGPNDGLIVLPAAPAVIHRALIVALAARHKLPTIFPFRFLRHQRRPDLLWA